MEIKININVSAYFERKNRLFIETSVGIFPAERVVTTALIGKTLYKETYICSSILGKDVKILVDREYRGEYTGGSYLLSLKELLKK